MKHIGLHDYRLKPEADNAREVAFAKQWKFENEGPSDILAWLLGDGRKKAIVSDRDAKVAATVIQWLGSNVGISFILEVMKKEPKVWSCFAIKK